MKRTADNWLARAAPVLLAGDKPGMVVIRRTVVVLALLAAAAATLLLSSGPARAQAPVAYSIELPGSIDPATEQWIHNALEDAADDGAELAIIRLDTPGGLDSSLREIVQDIIAAPMPVVVYVYPDGARAASAGLFITQAADVAAMAPLTNIGSASPVSFSGEDFGEVLGRKIENDAAAYVRALAEAHGRNPELAEEMVLDATNVTATEALDADLIDIVATDTDDLLAQLDGFEVQGPKATTLETEGFEVEERDMPLQFELLQIIVNPNVAFLLLLVGLIGIAIEAFAPGGIIPGAFGAVALLLGLYGTLQLPVTLVGALLVLLAVGLFVAEAQLPTGGLLGVAGVVALGAGGLLLFDTDSDEFGVSAPVVIAIAIALGAGLAVIAGKVVATRDSPPLAGSEELIGLAGEVRTTLDPIGQIFVNGVLWRGRVRPEQAPVEPGARVTVESIDGLTLNVSRSGTGGEGAGTGASRANQSHEAEERS